jgi:hypothetical protein
MRQPSLMYAGCDYNRSEFLLDRLRRLLIHFAGAPYDPLASLYSAQVVWCRRCRDRQQRLGMRSGRFGVGGTISSTSVPNFLPLTVSVFGWCCGLEDRAVATKFHPQCC